MIKQQDQPDKDHVRVAAFGRQQACCERKVRPTIVLSPEIAFWGLFFIFLLLFSRLCLLHMLPLATQAPYLDPLQVFASSASNSRISRRWELDWRFLGSWLACRSHKWGKLASTAKEVCEWSLLPRCSVAPKMLSTNLIRKVMRCSKFGGWDQKPDLSRQIKQSVHKRTHDVWHLIVPALCRFSHCVLCLGNSH